MKTGTIINLIFDANRGSVDQLSREGIVGEAYGKLPTPTRRGYAFSGWYYGDVQITADAIIETDEDIRLVAHWEKATPEKNQKRSMFKRQKIAIAALAVVAVLLIITFVIVAQLISIYTFVDTYTVDGVEYNDKYYIKRQDGVYKLFDADGNLMETNGVLGTTFIAKGSGNQYRIDPDTGEHTLRATVDAEDGEYTSGTILLMFPQILSADLYSITMQNTVKDDQGEQIRNYTVYRTADGFKIKGYEKSNLEFDQNLFAQLCFSCGYMMSTRKMGANSTDPLIPRLEDGTIDYSVYGLDTPQATYTIEGILYKKNPDGTDMYKNGKYVVDYDENGNPQPDPEKTYTVHIGDAILSGAGYYVRLEGRGSVYIVTTDYIETTVLQPIEELIVPRVVFPVSVTYHSMGKDFWLGYLSDWNNSSNAETIVSFTYSELEERINTMNSTRPYLPGISVMSGYHINENSAISIFETFYSIEAIACRQIGLNAETMAKFGLDKDVYYLTYKTHTSNVDENGDMLYATNELFIGQKTPQGTYYVAVVPFDMIVEVDQYYLSFLEWDYLKWYNEAFIFHNIAYVRDIKFEFNGATFGSGSDKTFYFELDNSLSYAFYVDGYGSFQGVNLSEGKVYIEGGKKVYKVNGKTYDIVAEVDLDTATVVSNKDIIMNSALTDVVYVKESFYYVNSEGQNVAVSPDYNTKTIEYVIEYDQDGKYIGGYYYYIDTNRNERIRVNRSLGDPVYRYTYNGKTYEATLGVNAAGLLVSCNGELLEYNISNSGMGDAGVTEYETITATDNFRKLHMQLLYFSLMGDVDPVEFEASMGMSVEEYLASDSKKPIATISAHVEDYARVLNGYTYYDKDGKEIRQYDENISQYIEYKFYQYSDWKVLVTVELFTKDENGEFKTNSPDGVVGKFYASTAILEKISSDIDRLLNAEVIDSSTKH